jgi:hypothetical protein
LSREAKVLFCKDSTVGLQVVLRDARLIHPQTQAFVANELGGTNGLFDGSKLILPYAEMQGEKDGSHMMNMCIEIGDNKW